LLWTLLGLGLVGCEGKPAGTLEPGTHVTMVKDDGNFAQVQTQDGRTVYVPSGVLKQRSQADGTAGTYTHELSAAAEVYRGGAPAYVSTPPPRGEMDILQEQIGLNRLFLSEKSLQEVVAPANTFPTFHGEKCWPAYMCTNPDCPGKDRGREGVPYLFIHTDQSIPNAICPACLEIRNLEAETDEDKLRYRNYPRLFELPETQRRLDELARERKSLYGFLQEQAREREEAGSQP